MRSILRIVRSPALQEKDDTQQANSENFLGVTPERDILLVRTTILFSSTSSRSINLHFLSTPVSLIAIFGIHSLFSAD